MHARTHAHMRAPAAERGEVLKSTETLRVVCVLFLTMNSMDPLFSGRRMVMGSNSTSTKVASVISTLATPTPMIVPAEGELRIA